MPVKERERVEVVGEEEEGGSGSSSGSSSSSSSGSDSSSGSNSSSSDDASSSDDDSASSAASPPNKPPPPSSNNNNTNGVETRRSRSCSSSRSQSRASSVSSAASSVKSKASRSSKSSAKKVLTLATKKATATSTTSNKPLKPSSHHHGHNSNSNGEGKGASSKGRNHNQKGHSAVGANSTKGNKGGQHVSTSSGSSKQQGSSKKGGNLEEDNKGSSSSKGHQSTSSTSKSKVVKSGTVTNARTIKPLHSASSTTMKKRTLPIAGKTPPVPISKLKESIAKAERSGKKSLMGVKKKPPSLSVGNSKAKVEKAKKAPVRKAPETKKKQEKVVSSTKTVAPPVKEGIKTRASSCSSASASTSSSVESSCDEAPEDSSLTESSPLKSNNERKGQRPLIKSGKLNAVKNGKELSKGNKSKSSVVRNLASEMLSSADESETKESGESKPKKKQPQRRPLTRRQKSGVKKTIPTFNQSLLLAASSNSVGSPSGTPKKSSVAAVASSSSDLPVSRLPPSTIISRRSTSNSSTNSSESESTEMNSSRKKFPFSSLTTQSSSKNKYLSTWDSDFSDDNFSQHINSSAANFIRVPAKTSNRPRTFDFSQSLLDPESYEPPQCPFPSCDSTGHLSGKYPTHNFLSCCPRYHGFESTECIENEEERSQRESERTRYRNILSTPGKKPPKPTSETKAWICTMKDLKETQTKDGLVSDYDNLLWKDSLAIAADRVEKEQNEGINNQGMYYRLSMAVAMGRFEMKCWCASPYPDPLNQNRRLFVCEFCLKPVASGTVLRRHCAKCVWRHPPGDEIYRKDRLSVWEVDGKKQKTYCQNLCLLAKCFLDHKTLYLDVDPFLFYVMTLADNQGCHLVGYFSKEKNSFLNYNVSCILTLPPYMRQGFGRLLIDFSYLLTRVEGKVGSPEKPLSDLGLISYRSYWKDAVLRRMCACASREINIKDLSIELGVSTADLISTLQFLGMLKYWKGKHLVLKKQDVLEEYLERVRRRGNERQIDSSCLRWRPYQPPPDEHSSSEKS